MCSRFLGDVTAVLEDSSVPVSDACCLFNACCGLANVFEVWSFDKNLVPIYSYGNVVHEGCFAWGFFSEEVFYVNCSPFNCNGDREVS